jgi:hypothetical protein
MRRTEEPSRPRNASPWKISHTGRIRGFDWGLIPDSDVSLKSDRVVFLGGILILPIALSR